MDYREYLSSSCWKEKREKVLSKIGACQKCGSKENLNVHHSTYKNLGKERIRSLYVLCKSCHFDFHDKFGTKNLSRNTKKYLGIKKEKRERIIKKELLDFIENGGKFKNSGYTIGEWKFHCRYIRKQKNARQIF